MNKRARHLTLAAFGFIALSSLPRHAHGDDASADKKRADALFDEAKALMHDERYVEACPKFAASNAIDPGVGGLLWEGECDERANRPTAAWRSFSAAETMATKRGDARASVAHDRRERLDPVIARFRVDTTSVTNVLLDGHDDVALAAAAEDVVDPGPHTFVVTRSDGATWSAPVVAHAGDRIVLRPIFVADSAAPDGPIAVSLPAAEAPGASEPVSFAAPATASTTGNPTWMSIGIGAAAAGLVGIGTGLYLGMDAKSTYDTARSTGHCTANNQCDAEGLRSRDHADMLARDATIFVAAGAGVAAVGAVVAIKWWNVRVTPSAGRSSAGLAAVGTF